MKKSHLVRLNVSPVCAEQMELGEQLRHYLGVVQSGIVGELPPEITGGVIVRKCHVVVVIARRREATARIGAQPGTGVLSSARVRTEVHLAIETGAEKEVQHASGVAQCAETEVHAIKTETTDRNPETTRTGR
jgi:hypothetical protein